MKKLFSIILIFTTFKLFAQDSLFYTTESTVQVTAIDFKTSKDKLKNFIKQYQITPWRQNENQYSITINANVSKPVFDKFLEMVTSLGYVTSNNTNTINNSLRGNDIKMEIQYLKQKKESYEKLMKKIEDKSEKHIALWNENKNIEENIFHKEKELLPLLQKTHNYNIYIEIWDEQTTPDKTKVAFINMPGFEYSFLMVENPLLGVSSNNYQGYFLKYMFTKGKSFAFVGAYTSTEAKKVENLRFSELFILGFGQDFYSRYLGRGSRKFFNLYSGYSLGYVLATGTQKTAHDFLLSPSVGIELFKNKYLLLDTKFGYFIPIFNNKNLRGFNINASLNFVF